MNSLSQYIQSKKFQNTLSYWVIAIIACYVVIVNYNTRYWEKENMVIASDVGRYYVYLPAIFIHNDLSFEYFDEEYEKNIYRIGFFKSPKGEKMVITTFGMAIAYSPFFLVAHALASPLGFEANGYTSPYKFALMFSSLFYLILGLFFLRKFLLKYFDSIVTAITLLIIGIGTNITHYLTKEAPMPHVYEFALTSIYLYLVSRWYNKPKLVTSFWLGLMAGLITLIRPTNILVIMIFLLWRITAINDLVERFRMFIKSYKAIIIMTLSFILIWFPQFLYWHDISGSIFFNSYDKSGSGFYFDNPQIINQWFSYRKGWLLYTPIMILALFGFRFLYKRRREFFWPVLIYFLLMIYILSCWWSWWFGGGYSIRSYIDMYSILAIPIATPVSAILNTKFIPVKVLSLTVVGCFLFLNLFQTYQYRRGVIHYDSMTKKAYWEVFLKKQHPYYFYELLEKPDYSKARQGIYENFPDYYSKE